jgi:hypothetical protein
MDEAKVKLLEQLIRLAKGMIKALEQYVEEIKKGERDDQ